MDTVNITMLSYTLAANLENLTFNGTGNFTGTGNQFANVITGGVGNDRFVATVGDDIYDAGLGTDTYDLSGTAAGATVNLGLGTSTSAATSTDTLTSIENVIGGSGNDTFVASLGDGTNDNRLQLLQLAVALVRSGWDPTSIGRLAHLLAVDAAEAALKFIWQRNGMRKTGQLHRCALLLVKLVKHWVKVSPEHLEALRQLRKKVNPGCSGMPQHAWPGRTAERAVTCPSVGIRIPAYARPIGRSHQPRKEHRAHDPHRPRRPPAAPGAAAAEARDARAG